MELYAFEVKEVAYCNCICVVKQAVVVTFRAPCSEAYRVTACT
jgi:hypothetical protein